MQHTQTLSNRRIVYFHSPRWYDFFRDFLLHLQLEYNCELTIISTEDIRPRYKKNLTAGAAWEPQLSVSRPRSWEDDPAEVERLETIMRECEEAAGLSTGRIILVGERDLGRSLTLDSHFFPNNPERHCATANSGNPRKLLLRHFHFADDIFRRYEPDLVLGRGHASPPTLTFWFMAKRAGIPSLACRESNFKSNRSFWTDDYYLYNTAAETLFREKLEADAPVSDHAKAHLEGFREDPKAIEDVRLFWASALKNALGLRNGLRASWQTARERLRYFRKGYRCKEPPFALAVLKHFVRRRVLSSMCGRYHTEINEQELRNTRYVYMALHKEPEIVLNFRTPLWHNQLNTVKLISSLLPAGCQFIVREHRGNWGRRPLRFLRQLSGLPGVRLVHSFDSQYKYITNANLIITDVGTTGLEGLIFKRPVITLEHIHYNMTDLVHRADDLQSLDKLMLATMDAPPRYPEEEYEKRLGWFIDAEMETTMDVEEMLGDIGMSLEPLADILKHYPR